METPDETQPAAPPHPCFSRGGRSRWWKRCGLKETGFTYCDHNGLPLPEAAVERIRALVIPPAWTEVRIAPSERSPLQVLGLDTGGRPQYRYHPRFVAKHQALKYDKLRRFGEALPALRRETNAHLGDPSLSKERVLAVTLRLINDLYFRVGSDASVEKYETFGITTLQNRHLTLKPGGVLLFDFIGKKHVPQKRVLTDPALAATLQEIKALRGQRLFQYRDESGAVHPILARDVNAYLKRVAGPEFSAKDFRTWGGTLHAAIALAELGPETNERKRAKNMGAAAKSVSEWLGNTPAVCRAAYIHPLVFDLYEKGITLTDFRSRRERRIVQLQPEYEPEEVSLLALLAQGQPSAPGRAAFAAEPALCR